MNDTNVATLTPFITSAKSKGASDEFLCSLLIRNGWPANEVYESLGQYWQAATGVTLPVRAGTGESAREAFLYLLSFSTLATWTISLGGLIFDLINRWLPDPVSRAYVPDLRLALTWEIARVLVAFPIYLAVTALVVKEAVKYPDRLQSGVRKWLTYIALLGTAGTMICDLIWFLDYLLSGEITLRFVLKSATVMILCAGIFAYYLGSLRLARASTVTTARLRNRAFAAVASVLALVALCVGISIAGTPTMQRTVEADRVRVDNLRQIAEAVRGWHIRAAFANPHATVPAMLEELIQAGNGIPPSTVDPLTRVAYTYRPVSGNRYELCAGFTASNGAEHGTFNHSEFWHHGQGQTCFVLDAGDPVPY
jgi:hypothetical protein